METFLPLIFVAVVSLVVEILKRLEQKVVGLNDRAKDVVYAVLAGLLVALAKYFGLVDLDWSVIMPLLFAPQGVFTVIKKIFNK